MIEEATYPTKTLRQPAAEHEHFNDDTIVSILPLDEDGMDLVEHPSILTAQNECDRLVEGNLVEVFIDEEVAKPIVELYGPEARVVFNVQSVLPYFVMFVKNLDQYFHFEIEILDENYKYRTIRVSNTISIARVQALTCQLPFKLGHGWRYVVMDLHDLTQRCFGTTFLTTVQIRVYASCRLYKMFLQDKMYSDAELPSHLRLLV